MNHPPGLFWRLRWLLLGVGLFVGLWVVVLAGNSVGRYAGWIVPQNPPTALAESLRPYYRVSTPPGEGPFPTALLYSGCDGPGDNLDRWTEMLVSKGWAAIVIDSHRPRNLLDNEAWRLICAGQLLMGSERAGDVLVSIYDARRLPFVDPERLVLIGASHGGWAIMELLLFEKQWRLPYNLSALPDGDAARPLDGVVGSILIYPYCGAANRARREAWTYPAPVLFLLAEDDLIAPHGDCLAIADLVRAQGVAVETRIFNGVTHGFDQSHKAPLSLLEFDPEATAEALALAGRLLDRVGSPDGTAATR